MSETGNSADLAAMRQRLAELEAMLRAREKREALIFDAVSQIAAELDFDTVLQLVADRARKLVSADSLVVPLVDEGGGSYTYFAGSGELADDIVGQTLPMDVGMCGWVMRHRKPLLFGEGSSGAGDEFNQWEQGMQSALLVPLKSRGDFIGGLAAMGKQGGGSFSEEDQALLELFASHISLVIDRTNIYRQLEEQKEWAELTLRSIGDAVVTTNLAGVITAMNPVAARLTGWREEDAVGMLLPQVFRIIDGQTGRPVDNPVSRVLDENRTVMLDRNTILISKGGVEYHIADSAAPIKNREGQTVGVILVFSDTTESYEMRSRLEKERVQLKAILDNTSLLVYVRDLEGRFVLVNKQFEQLFGVDSKTAVGQRGEQVLPEAVAAEFARGDDEVVSSRQAVESEVRLALEDGERSYLCVKFPLFDTDHYLEAVCSVMTDITAYQQTQEALRRSQKMEALGQLTGGIAHDFNNQVGIILGYQSLLADSLTLDDRQAKWLRNAGTAAKRCADLTRQLLSFSRKDSGSDALEDINPCIESIQDVINRSVTPEIHVQYYLADDLPQVRVNRGELQDAIINLVLNARDAMPDGGELQIGSASLESTTEVPLAENLAPGRYVMVYVSDTGEGISEADRNRIFEPFFTTKPSGQGTGLGLSMVFGLVKRLQGGISVRSAEGSGTTFSLFLPAAACSEPEATQPSRQPQLPGGNECILAVDDETELLELAVLYLEQLGYRVQSASNGAAALAILQNDAHIDLLFSDVVMPGMNGTELASQARQLRPALKVLYTSGYASKADDQALKNSRLLHKPYDLSGLAHAVRSVLDES